MTTTPTAPAATTPPPAAPASRHRSDGPARGLLHAGRSAVGGWSIGTKLSAVMAVMIALLVTTATVLASDVRTVAGNYEQLLRSQTRSSALQAQEIEIEFKIQVQEWKNILLRGSSPQDLDTYTGQFRGQIGKVDALAAELAATAEDEGVRGELDAFRVEYAALNAAYDAALAAFVADPDRDPRAPDAAVRGLDRPIDERIRAIVARSQQVLTERIAQENEAVAARETTLLATGLLLLVLVLGALAFVVTRIVRPLRRLTEEAYHVAHEALPRAIEDIRRSSSAAAVPELPALQVPTRDELHDLAAALTTVQSRAVELAVEQHRSERESAAMLIDLGRRNQSLLKRTLGYITELESQERDADVLDKLFRLDHATTRIRRNAESMLVLAGAAQTRTWSRAVDVGEVVRAGLSEIEDYVRVDVHHVEDAAVVGTAVADVVHLLAELLENAAHFSPPSTRVTVVGQRTADGYRIRIIDQGVGMTDGELREANARIARAADGRTRSNLLGLHVVGRLAHRRGVSVVLEPSAGRGITATAVLPPAVLADPGDAGPGREPPRAAAPPARPTGLPVRVPAPASAPAPAPAPALQRRVPSVPRTIEPFAAVDDAAVPVAAAARRAGGAGGPAGRLDDLFAPAPRPAVDDDGIPRRVRGAQLPDLGPGHDGGPAFAAPDPEQVRGRLSALISGVEHGRRGPGADS